MDGMRKPDILRNRVDPNPGDRCLGLRKTGQRLYGRAVVLDGHMTAHADVLTGKSRLKTRVLNDMAIAALDAHRGMLLMAERDRLSGRLLGESLLDNGRWRLLSRQKSATDKQEQ